ncbi:hypothetical protein BX616_008099 [Lobosporangium transversale]|uniref:Uncharacterized protein n=1 Tax=Lobosporangium transversale TaxID=64571 RepID=A0A1Y2GJ32_9FUNG|nr:hypothetical protein BCR41DRAFT_388552 [Lobosporangium transversale]KAF9914538.1 hypothetical protein BX616_008099 [Lobosporangium transversale]ORZ08847.1 hypothetical protein BCR41DRAFT_388552 [Lobosporangium transversale]|eukprot:XP_021878630.1 hypothetical protein BCR41DRAFT_388552 [Lobosporangium transversale]
MTAVPTLPFVLLKAHKPYSTSDIVALNAAAATSAPLTSATMTATGRSSSSHSLMDSRPVLRSASTTDARASPGLGIEAAPTSSISSSTAPATVKATDPSTDSNPISSLSSVIQTRAIHPQVHYIFEDDPLESDILESIPKSRSITLDLDPKSGTISNVESFMTHLQIMDIKLVPLQTTLTNATTTVMTTTTNAATSASSASLNSLGVIPSAGNTDTGSEGSHNNIAHTQVFAMTDTTSSINNTNNGSPLAAAAAAALYRTDSYGASSNQSSMTMSSTKMARKTSERSLMGQAGITLAPAASLTATARGNDIEDDLKSHRNDDATLPTAILNASISVSAAGASSPSSSIREPIIKDWTLVIDVVEVDEEDHESDSEVLDQSMISSLDTDVIPGNYLSHCEALLKSFSARNLLVHKMIDFNDISPPLKGNPH